MSDHTPSGAYAPGTHPDLPPPPASTGIAGWIRQNLIPSFVHGGITAGVTLVIALVLYFAVGMSVLSALAISGSAMVRAGPPVAGRPGRFAGASTRRCVEPASIQPPVEPIGLVLAWFFWYFAIPSPNPT